MYSIAEALSFGASGVKLCATAVIQDTWLLLLLLYGIVSTLSPLSGCLSSPCLFSRISIDQNCLFPITSVPVPGQGVVSMFEQPI